jgi:hypothetical protein
MEPTSNNSIHLTPAEIYQTASDHVPTLIPPAAAVHQVAKRQLDEAAVPPTQKQCIDPSLLDHQGALHWMKTHTQEPIPAAIQRTL